jgi:hypothetical protein
MYVLDAHSSGNEFSVADTAPVSAGAVIVPQT